MAQPADLPAQVQERIVCSIAAAVKYEVPANMMLAIAEKEAGKPGQWVRNANGTYDVGPLQFNTSYLRGLAQYGITASHVAQSGCYPYDLAAWRLRGHLHNDKGDLLTRAANYHSRTPKHNSVYRADFMLKAAKWANWIEARFVTHDVKKAGVTGSTLGLQPSMIGHNRESLPRGSMIFRSHGDRIVAQHENDGKILFRPGGLATRACHSLLVIDEDLCR